MTKGDNARKARRAKKISQDDMAYVVSVTQGTISKFENDQLKNPSVYMVLKYALICEKNITDLIDMDKIKMEIAERS